MKQHADPLTPHQNEIIVDSGSGINTFGDIGKSVNTAKAVIVSQAKPMSLDSALIASGTPSHEPTLKDYFARPQVVSTGVLQNTDVATTFTKYKALNSYISSTFASLKMTGRYSYRGDLRFRLQVNATRFQQGRYILAWVPSGGDAGMTAADGFVRFHAQNLTQVTQLPHVEIDISCDTEVELLVPFTAYFNSAQYGSSSILGPDIGTVFMTPYSALTAVAGALSAQYTLWVSMENVHLYANAIPQSGMRMKMKKKNKKLPTEDEVESVGKGPISTVLNGVSSFAGALASIPMLTEIAAPVSWVTGVLARTAQSFGWSKPIDESPANRVVRTVQPFFSNVDTVDPGYNMAMSISNKISVLPGFAGTDIDEMSFDYIKSIPAHWNTVTWNTAAAFDTEIFSKPVGPQYNGFTFAGLGGTCTALAPIAYLAKGFTYWRGSITYTFKIVKTEFHSGRLLVSFNPFNGFYPGTLFGVTVADSQYTIREVIDIRRGNEFTVTVPYVNMESWSTTGPTGRTGYINIRVLDPLVAPSTVSSSITILVETSGGEDFELAVPTGTIAGHNPILMASYQSGFSKPKKFTFQSGMASSNDEVCEVSNIVLGEQDSISDATFVAPSFSCIGEKIVSLRQYLKRFSPIMLNVSGAAGTYLKGDATAVGYNVNPTMDINIDAAVVVPSIYGADPFTYFGSMYALFRGSMRYRFTDIGNTSSGTVMLAAVSSGTTSSNTYTGVVSPTTFPISGPDFIRLHGYDNLAVSQVISNAGIEVTVPFYNRNHSLPVRGLLMNGTNNNNPFGISNADVEAPKTGVGVRFSGANPNIIASRAIGDDASFGRFVSTPVLAGNQLYTA